jgi:hypothetical protein
MRTTAPWMALALPEWVDRLTNSLPKLDAQGNFIVEFFADCTLENGHVFVDKIMN